MNKRYVVTKPAFKAHYAVAAADGQDKYYIKIKIKIKPSQPRLAFHSGTDSSGPVVSVLYFQAPNVGMKVGLGHRRHGHGRMGGPVVNKQGHACQVYLVCESSAGRRNGPLDGRAADIYVDAHPEPGHRWHEADRGDEAPLEAV